jgi:hypothetical protein
MRAMGRWVGYLLLALAVVAVTADGVEAVRAGAYRAATLGEWWAGIAPRSLDAVLGASPWLTENFTATVIATPASVVLAVLGVLLAVACRRRNGRRRRRARGI